ncbi:trehalase family glycosidase [Rhodanobacter sp. DHB23]|uniref:MGH1-like glycoside hydrolase domain-containing protein n=1 Tax=Rhodanobacter sp. DHB23 TaxID=2775923 RepID=UPI00177FB0CE|nr:trehalase family glycosidase [Rhodanobacter sp. DHB23]MBD8872754.1 glycoside hydrolase [Rhodanobacter sp. DHB23]
MRPFIKPLLLAAAMAAAFAVQAGQPAAPYQDLLDFHGSPRTAADRSFNIFFDMGAWQGYSLPRAGDAGTGFSGPFVHSLGAGQWAGVRLAALSLRDASGDIALKDVASHAMPGALEREFSAQGLDVRQTLFFADSWHALVRIELEAGKARDVELAIGGNTMPLPGSHLASDGAAVTQGFAGSPSTLTTQLHADGLAADHASVSGNDYRIALDQPLHLEAGKPVTLYLVQTLRYDTQAQPPAIDYAHAWDANRARWAAYLKSADTSHLAGLPDDVARRVAAKAVVTLIGNWRAARGDLHHDGVIPSYSNPDFNGFWAWDSWKHAAALAWFAPDLARAQIRAMFDYQGADGMVPDCIYLDHADDNWRDSKPPLATWAVMQVYRATGDRAFLAEMYDKLVRYHRWWFADRDHDHNGLAEFGSTDGTRIAAAWESGMDNAVRFDGAKMLKNSEHAWSLDQESVDLNAYLQREAAELAQIAGVLGKPQDQRQWQAQADAMKAAIQSRMYDAKLGWFFDARLGKPDLVRVYGSEGWAPLWAGVATPAQAAAVEKTMMDARKFATTMPFPTLAADDPHFSPIKGYWRGPVWMDQSLFGVEALQRYGYTREADAMARRLVLNAKGLAAGQATFRENYDPLTGNGYQSQNFSWSAASYLLLLGDKDDTAPRIQ